MYHLTTNAHPVYSFPAANVLAVGFSDLNGQNNGAQAPSNSLGVFLCLKGFPLVVCGGNPKGLPVQAVGVRRFANPSHAATIIFSEMWCQLVFNQTQDTIMAQKITAFMPEDCFAFNPNVDTSKLYDPIYIALNRAQALLSLIQRDGEDMAEGFTLPHSALMYALDGVDADIKQAQQLIDLWLSAPADSTEAGEAN